MPDIPSLVMELDAADPRVVYRARRRLFEEIHRSLRPDGEEDRRRLAAALADALTAPNPAPVPARIWVCRGLGLLGVEAGITALQVAAANPETADAACAALGMITSAKSDAALKAGMGKEQDPRRRLAFVQALAQQRGLGAGRFLETVAMKDQSEAVRLYALEGAANFPIILADPTFVTVAKQSSARERANAHRARVRFADCLRYSGYKHPARTVAESILSSDAPAPQRAAARRLLDRLK